MEEVTFNDKKYLVPCSWNEVTLKMVIKASQLSDILVDSPIIAIISAYSGIDPQELKVSKVQEANEILNILDFIYKEYQPEMKNSFEFSGITYSANEDISQQEFQDFVSLQTILYNYKENPVLGLPKLIAVLAKRENESLDDFNLQERSDMFLDLPFTTAKDLEFFFSRSAIAWNYVSQLYSQMPAMEKQVLDSFKELRDTMSRRMELLGWYSPTRWLIGAYLIYLNYIRRGVQKSFSLQSSKDLKKN